MIRPEVAKEEPLPLPPEPEAPHVAPRAPAAPPRRVPPLAELVRVPATFGLTVLAITLTLVSWMHPLVDVLAMQTDILHDAPWRPFTTTLLHVNLLHLWFNAYWLLALGTPIERANGTLRTALGYVIVGMVSSLAEHALFRGGVGLSGIGYGTFAYGWVRAQREPAWAKIVDPGTARAFGFWFVLCIVMTVSDVLPVANVAHGVGAIVGGLFALAERHRAAIPALIAVSVLAFVLDAAPVRDRINLIGQPAIEAEQRGLLALDSGDPDRARRELAHAAELSPGDARVLYNFGVAQEQAGDPAACDTFRRVVTLAPDDELAQQALRLCTR